MSNTIVRPQVPDVKGDPDGLTVHDMMAAADQCFSTSYEVQEASPAPLVCVLVNPFPQREQIVFTPGRIWIAQDASGKLYAARHNSRGRLVHPVLTPMLREKAGGHA